MVSPEMRGEAENEGASESEEPTSETEGRTSESEGPTTEFEGPTTESEGPTTESGDRTSESEGPTTETEGPTTETEGPTTESEGPTSESEGPTTESEGPTTETEGRTTETEGRASESEEPASESGSDSPRAPRRRAASRPRERVSAGMAIVRKDVGQARFVLVAAFTWAVLVVALQVGLTWTPERLLAVANLRGLVPDSPERILRGFALLGLLPLAVVLAWRTVLSESQLDAWRALELLPVRPSVILLSKAGHGLGLLGVAAVTGTLLVISGSPFANDFNEARSLATLGATFGFGALVFSALYFAALFGRHRLLALGVLAGLALHSGRWTEVPGVELFDRHLDASLAPRLYLQGGLIAALILGGTALACARGRALLRAGRGPMQAKDGLRALCLALLAMGLATLRRPPLPTLRMAPPSVRPELSVELEVCGFRPEEEARARELAAALGADLQWLSGLGVQLPPVAVEVVRGADPGVFRRATLRGVRGVLVYAPYHLPGLSLPELRAYVLDQVVEESGRWRRGSGQVLRLGLGRYRAEPPRLRAQAAWAALRVAAEGELPGPEAWSRLAGDEPARSLAAWVLGDTQRSGDGTEDVLQPLLAGELSPAELTGLLSRACGALEQDAPSLPPLEVEHRIAFAPGGQLRLDLGEGVAPVQSARWVLLHGEGRGEPEQDLLFDPRARGLTAVRRYFPGARVRCALALRSQALGCDLIYGWRELVVR